MTGVWNKQEIRKSTLLFCTAQIGILESKALDVFVGKMTGAIALGSRKTSYILLQLVEYNVSNKSEVVGIH